MGYGTILVADDDRDILQLLDMELSSEGYRVVPANSGQEAVKKAETFKPDLILMDVLMPDINGGQAIKMLRSSDKTKNIPVIFLTAMLSEEEERSGKMGITIDGVAYSTLAKPFDGPKLLSQIHKYM